MESLCGKNTGWGCLETSAQNIWILEGCERGMEKLHTEELRIYTLLG